MSDASNVRVAVSGAIWKGAYGATAPTGTADAPAEHEDLGYISEDGTEISIPGAGDSTPIKAWQNGATVRTIRTTSDDLPTWHFTMLETTLDTIELYFGVTVTQTATEGSFEYKVEQRNPNSIIVDSIDGAELLRDYIPNATVTELGAHTLSNGTVTGYEVTVAGDLDPIKNYNFKRWSTALKTAA